MLAPQPTAPAPAQPPILVEAKARAKVLKKHRKHESRRVLYGICACLHAIGFSF